MYTGVFAPAAPFAPVPSQDEASIITGTLSMFGLHSRDIMLALDKVSIYLVVSLPSYLRRLYTVYALS